MLKALLFLAAIVLVQIEALKEPHPDCPAYGHKLLPHEWDCKLFYYCEGGMKFIEPRNCSTGTEFSPTLQVCVHLSSSDCTLPGYPPEEPDTTAAPTTAAPTTAAPTTAAPTTAEPTTAAPTTAAPTTAAPTTAAPTTAAPTTAAPTTAAPTTTAPTTAAPTTAAPTTAAPTTAAPTTAAPTTTAPTTAAPTAVPTNAPSDITTADPCEYFDNGCPVDFDIHLLLPHATSCRKFYICVHGEKVPSKCGHGTVFNPVLQICDHAANVDRTCEDDDSSSEEPETEESKESVEIERLPNGCPVDWNIPGYVAHEYYCNLYYQCIFGVLVERRCGTGTHFNPVEGVCDHIANVNCILPGGDAPIEEPVTPDDPFTTVRPPSEVLDNGCPVDGMINWMLPHEDDCTLYYHCVWGSLVLMTCPGSLHFAPHLQRCENPAIAGCICVDNTCSEELCSNEDIDSNSSEEPPFNNDDEDDSEEPEPTLAPSTIAPTTILPTASGPTTSAPTTSAPTTSAPTTSAPTTSDPTTSAPTTIAPTTILPTTSGPTTSAPTTSAPTTSEPTTSAPTTNAPITDDTTTIAPTTSAPTTSAPTTSAPTTSAPTTSAPTTSAPTTSTTTNSPNECDDPEEINPCEDECNVFPWAHKDCDKYYMCDDKTPIIITCSEGLHFNPQTYTCDFICNAGCVRNHIQTTAGTDGLRMFLPWSQINSRTEDLLELITSDH